jgi:hypothetical protein
MLASPPIEFRARAPQLARVRAKRADRGVFEAARFEWIECVDDPQRRHSTVAMLISIDSQTTAT